MKHYDNSPEPGPETSRNQSAGRIEDAELRYRALFEQSPDGILTIDTRGHILEFNRAAHTMLGYSRDEFAGINISQITLQTPGEIQSCIDKLLHDGKAEFEVRYRTRSGAVKNVYVISKMIISSGETVMLSIWRDVTERKKIEADLRESEKFIRGILESVDEGFIVVDHDLRIMSANNAYLGQVGRTRDEITGRHCYEISHGSSRPCYVAGEECPVKRTLQTGEAGSALHVHRQQDGTAVHTEIKSFPLKDSEGRTSAAIEIINNTTERRNLEDQLRQSQKMEAVGRLAGGIAHDFNNILTAITGYASLVRMQLGDGHTLAGNVQQILDSAERAANLTRGLLAFSRKQEISAQPLNLNFVVRNFEALLRRLIGEDIDVSVDLWSRELPVLADSGQLEQVLMNLATNAKDAMPAGGRLTIRTEAFSGDEEFIKTHGCGEPGLFSLLTVRDTGTGMDDTIRQRIFEPFFTTKETGKGTGLGLSIVYGIVKQHNGCIKCVSEPGKGTEFRIYLPLIGTNSEIDQADRKPEPVPSGTATILVAEDDAILRSLVREVLEQFGYTVIEAIDGEDAIAQFKKHRDQIDLLVLDVVMPKKNGIEVYEEIQGPGVPIRAVFTSGYTADVLQKRGLYEKDLNFIPKPVSPVDLLKKIRETLDG